jgi:hypothetical protein
MRLVQINKGVWVNIFKISRIECFRDTYLVFLDDRDDNREYHIVDPEYVRNVEHLLLLT